MGPKNGKGSFVIYNQRPPLSVEAEGPRGTYAGYQRGGLPEALARSWPPAARSPSGRGNGTVTSSAGAVPRGHEIMRCRRSPRSRFVGSAGTAGRPPR